MEREAEGHPLKKDTARLVGEMLVGAEVKELHTLFLE